MYTNLGLGQEHGLRVSKQTNKQTMKRQNIVWIGGLYAMLVVESKTYNQVAPKESGDLKCSMFSIFHTILVMRTICITLAPSGTEASHFITFKVELIRMY